MTRRRKLLIGGAVVLALGAGGVGYAQAGGDDDENVTGPDADRAKQAAVAVAGGGRAVGVEREDEGNAAWEVEVQRDGKTVEVKLTSDLKRAGRRDRRRLGRWRRDRERRPGLIRPLLLICACCALLAAGCGSDGDGDSTQSTTGTTATTQTTAANGAADLPQGDEPVELDPADFTTKIDNPYWPMPRGARWVYTSEQERIVVEVTNRKKRIAGVEALVLRDTVTQRDGGGFVEVTDDWYAQDKEGNVWYLGEDTKEYKDGKVVLDQGVVGARGGRRLCRDHHAREAAARDGLPAGVLRGRGRGPSGRC